MFIQSVASVLPLLLFIAAGFAVAEKPWCGRVGMSFLAKLNMDIMIPPYLFFAVATTYKNPTQLIQLAHNLRYPFLLTALALAVATVAVRLLRIEPTRRGVFINAVTMSNTVLMGMPVTVALFGEQAIPAAMVFYSANTLTFWTLGVYLLRRDVDSAAGKGSGLRNVLASRPLLGFLFGIAWVFTGQELPRFLARTFSMAGGVVVPVSMLFIGCVIRFACKELSGRLRQTAVLLAYRYTVVPLMSGIICSMLPVEPMMKKVFFLLCNMPAMAQLPIVAKEVGADYEAASFATAATTALSMAMVPILMMIMEGTNWFQ